MTIETHVCPKCNRTFAASPASGPDYQHSCEYETPIDVTVLQSGNLVATTSTRYQEEHQAIATNGPNLQGYNHYPPGETTQWGGLKGTVYQTASDYTVKLR